MIRLLAFLALLVSSPLALTIVQEDTRSTITAQWTYTPDPEYTTWYDYVVVDEAAGDTIMADSTSLLEVTFSLNRGEVDKAYRFGVRPVIQDALGSIARSQTWVDDRFIVPARPAAGLLAKRDMVTSPVIVPYDPAFEQPRGTVWLEFETRSDIASTQGLWSFDHTGYQDGGHLTVWIANGSVYARIQDDSTSYELQWVIVENAINQAAVEFGDDTGFRLHVNGALAMWDPYTGGTVGNQNDLVVGASKQNYNEDGSTPEYNNPFQGTVRVSEFYAGRYDFSGRWGLPPLPEPPPVDSLSVEVANIDRGLQENSDNAYMVVRFTPIPEAEWIRTYVDGAFNEERPALLPVAGGEWVVICSGACKSDSTWRGWEIHNTRTGQSCSATYGGWTTAGTAPCFTQGELLAMNERNPDCVGGRYWQKHDSEIECNFNILLSHRASWTFQAGTNPLLRVEILDQARQRIGYWERRAA